MRHAPARPYIGANRRARPPPAVRVSPQLKPCFRLRVRRIVDIVLKRRLGAEDQRVRPERLAGERVIAVFARVDDGPATFSIRVDGKFNARFRSILACRGCFAQPGLREVLLAQCANTASADAEDIQFREPAPA